MKRILSIIFVTLLSMSLGCWSAASIKESYKKTPVKTKSIGEGKSSFQFSYNGEKYDCFKLEDGKYKAVLMPKEDPKKE